MNEKNEGLTEDKLSRLKGYENVSDQQAKEIVLSIKKLAKLLCEYVFLEDKKERVVSKPANIIQLPIDESLNEYKECA